MSDKDGVAKNLEVVLKGISNFRAELQKIDREVAQAWDSKDWREYFHKVAAPPPEFFGLCRRLLGYIVMPFYYPIALAYYSAKNGIRRKTGENLK